jgi:lipid-A-disaccharide synthase-like uncharacterized protein
MDDQIRTLLYPAGFIATLIFTARFSVQWLMSEKRKESHTPPLFWRLSLLGNTILALHYFIQIQFPFALVQTMQGVLAWRNLNLIKSKELQVSKEDVIKRLVLAVGAVTLAFVAQGYLCYGHLDWMRTPTTPWGDGTRFHHSLALHVMGTFGEILFSSRFWIQWWKAEKHRKADLTPAFWWTSLIGAFITLIYGGLIGDPVIIIGHSFGLIPYWRNLQLLRRSRKAAA